MSILALRLVELFGYAPTDRSSASLKWREKSRCPFVKGPCVKTQTPGACTVQQSAGGAVICCPVRLYAEEYKILLHVADRAFGQGVELISPAEATSVEHDGKKVIMFGKHSGQELKLPKRSGMSGAYFVDWILARMGVDGHLAEFVAVEVQSIDTTGSYQDQLRAFQRGEEYQGWSKAGLNWENVSKRILPQIIYKGHVLRRERLCHKGLFFVTPTPVYSRIKERLGGTMLPYSNLQPGSLTFLWYNLGPEVDQGRRRTLQLEGEFRTTVDQVANAFTSPTNLPAENVYEGAILLQLKSKNE